MHQSPAGGAKGVTHVLLFDPEVEQIERHADGRVVDPIDELERLLGSVQEAGLEPIQRLDAEDHAVVRCVGAQRAQNAGDLVDVALALGRGAAPAAPHSGIKRTGDGRRPELLRHLDA